MLEISLQVFHSISFSVLLHKHPQMVNWYCRARHEIATASSISNFWVFSPGFRLLAKVIGTVFSTILYSAFMCFRFLMIYRTRCSWCNMSSTELAEGIFSAVSCFCYPGKFIFPRFIIFPSTIITPFPLSRHYTIVSHLKGGFERYKGQKRKKRFCFSENCDQSKLII